MRFLYRTLARAVLSAAGLLFLPSLAAPQAAGPEMPPELMVPATSAAIQIDGELDEPAWAEALRLELPYEIDPGENIPARVRTQLLLLSSQKHLLVGVRAFDPEPSRIRANLMDRDKAFDDDWVMVCFDPFLDRRRGFQFLVTPLGIQMDTLLTEIGHGGSEVDSTWDAIWDSAGRINRDGYVVEIAIPFTSLRFPRLQGVRRWGFQALRHYPRVFSYYFRANPWNRDRDCVLCENLIISGFAGAAPGGNLEMTPTATSLRTDERTPFPAGTLRGGAWKPELGLSGRWGITPSISLNAALNPDFSQVEADVAQLEINTRFALFYPEKRPFFLESMDLFRSPLQAIYTRTLADPDWGLKLTGKERKSGFAVLAGEDRVTNFVLPSNQGSEVAQLSQRALSTILRYRMDAGRRSSFGALVTNRHGSGYHNSVYGLDGQFQLSPRDRILVQFLGSVSAYPGTIRGQSTASDALRGLAWSLFYGHEARNWHWWSRAESLSRGFRADAGFIPRVDIRTAELGLRRVFWPGKEGWFSRINLSLEGLYAEDQAGHATDKSAELMAEIHGPLRSILGLSFVYHQELFNHLVFGQRYFDLRLSAQPRLNLNLLFAGKWGEAVDYAGSRPARVLRANPAAVYFINRHFQVQVDQLWERLEVEEGNLYLASLTQAHLIFMFNTRTFIRAIVQYLNVDRHPILDAAAAEAANRHLFTQFLFSYKVNPQTLIFLGYSDNSLALPGSILSQQSRTFFLKLSYAWVR